TKYMSFAPNAIVFLNVCFATADNEHALRFSNAVQQEGGRHYIGWTSLSSATGIFPAARYFVDRMLGANLFDSEDPLQRPFAAQPVIDDMLISGVGVDGFARIQLR